MHQHGPTEMTGPVRGTNTWWQGTGGSLEPAAPEATDLPPSGKRKARRKREVTDPARLQLIQRVRSEIAAGTYDSPEKWEAALDRLLDRLETE